MAGEQRIEVLVLAAVAGIDPRELDRVVGGAQLGLRFAKQAGSIHAFDGEDEDAPSRRACHGPAQPPLAAAVCETSVHASATRAKTVARMPATWPLAPDRKSTVAGCEDR